MAEAERTAIVTIRNVFCNELLSNYQQHGGGAQRNEMRDGNKTKDNNLGRAKVKVRGRMMSVKKRTESKTYKSKSHTNQRKEVYETDKKVSGDSKKRKWKKN